MKDIRRLGSVRSFPVQRRFFSINRSSERRSIGIDIKGRLGNGGDAKAVLEYSTMVGRSDEEYASEPFETLLVMDTAREFSGHTESSQSMGNRHCTGMVRW